MQSLTVASLLALVSLAACVTPQSGRVTVHNATAETIAEVTIEVSGNSLVARDLVAGGKTTFQFPIRHEDGYTVSARFASGRTQEAEVGYVAAGLPSDSQIEITSTTITEQLTPS